MTEPDYQLRIQTEAVRALLGSLHDLADTADEGLVVDMIEGETDLFEAIDGVLDRVNATEAMLAGLKQIGDRIKARRDTLKARIERLRALLEQALSIAELKRLQRPAATLVMHATAPNLIIEDEAAIPSRFYIQLPPPPPKLDEKALRAALGTGEQVAGARLSQGGIGLTIRHR